MRISRKFWSAVAFVQPGERLDLVADFAVGGQIVRLDPTAAQARAALSLAR